MTAPDAPERTTPPADPAQELPTLLGYLDYHRDTLLRKCAGLGAEQLAARACPPSTLSLLGLVRHLAQVEQAWFARIQGRPTQLVYSHVEDPDADILGASADPEVVDDAFETWRAAVARARAIATRVRADDACVGRPDLSVRWVLMHLVEEYARHNGHADLLREAIDGTTGE